MVGNEEEKKHRVTNDEMVVAAEDTEETGDVEGLSRQKGRGEETREK